MEDTKSIVPILYSGMHSILKREEVGEKGKMVGCDGAWQRCVKKNCYRRVLKVGLGIWWLREIGNTSDNRRSSGRNG